MVGGVRDDFVCEGGFPVYGGHTVGGGLVVSNVKVIYAVVGFCFCGEFHVGVDRIKILLYVVNVYVVGVINYQDVVDIAKIS
jgi:hypothetical protein